MENPNKEMNLSSITLILGENAYIRELFFIYMGSSWTIDSVYLYLSVPFAIVGLILNMMSVVILTRIVSKNTCLYSYLRASTLMSILVSIMVIMGAFTLTPRFFTALALSLFTRVFRCVVFNYVQTSLYFAVNILDLFILFERLAAFKPAWKKLSALSPSLTILATIFVCFLINCPLFFANHVNPDEEFYAEIANLSGNSSVNLCKVDSFMVSLYGLVLYAIVMLIKDVLTLGFEVYFSCLLLVYFQRFLRTKLSLRTFMNEADTQQKRTYQLKMTIMVITFSLMSIFSHVNMIVLYVLYTLSAATPLQVQIITQLIATKPVSNFIIFYIFNRHFRKAVSWRTLTTTS